MSKRTRSTNLRLADAEIREVIPTSDGGAYILSDDDQLWYVRGNKAVKVYEADSAKLSSQIFPNSTGSFFAQWVRERQHRKSLEAENQELEGRIDMLEGEMGELKNENGSGNEN